MTRKPAFLLLEVVVALALFVSGVAVCMHMMAMLTTQQKKSFDKLRMSGDERLRGAHE